MTDNNNRQINKTDCIKMLVHTWHGIITCTVKGTAIVEYEVVYCYVIARSAYPSNPRVSEGTVYKTMVLVSTSLS